MKNKTFYSLLIALTLLLLTCGLLWDGEVSAAEDADLVGTTITAAPNYTVLSAPAKLAYSADYLVVEDTGRLLVKTASGTKAVQEFEYTSIDEMHIIGNYLLAIIDSDTESPAVVAVDLVTGTLMDSAVYAPLTLRIGSTDAVPYSITPDRATGKLYGLYFDGGIYSFDYTLSPALAIGTAPISPITCQSPSRLSGLLKIAYKDFTDGGRIFALGYEGSKQYIKEYTLSTGVLTHWADVALNMDIINLTFAAGDTHLYLADSHQLELVDYTDKTDFTTTQFAVGGFAVSQEVLLISDTLGGGVKKYAFSKETGSFTILAEYASKGSSDTLLNTPLDVEGIRNSLYIADSGNRRISKYTIDGTRVSSVSTFTLPMTGDVRTTPKLLSSTDANLYVTDDAKHLFTYTTDGAYVTMSTLEFQPQFLATGRDGEIFLLADNRLYTYSHADGAESVAVLHDSAVCLAVSGHGNTVFVGTGTKIYCFTRTGALLDYTLALPENTTVSELVSDSKGNLYALLTATDGSTLLAYYTRTIDGYAEPVTRNVATQYPLTAAGLTFLSDDKIVTANSAYGVLVSIVPETAPYRSDSTHTLPVSTLKSPTEVVVKEGSMRLYAAYDNYESYVEVTAPTILAVVLFDYTHEDTDWCYVTVNGIYGYVQREMLATVVDTEPVYSTATILYKSVGIYSVPVADEKYLVTTLTDYTAKLSVDKRIGSYSETADLGYVHVTIDEYSGYCESKKLKEFEETIKVSTREDYMKVNAGKLGSTVPMLSEPVAGAEIMLDIADAEKVLLVDGYSADSPYTLVRYGDRVGYVATGCLLQMGLTDNQKTGVLLAVIVLIGGLVLYLILKRN